MFTSEELNTLYKNRSDKSITADRYRQIVSDYITAPWNPSKEEITDALKCI